jgi:RimJ/RimL family protein N-acetyltransferase
MTWISHPVTLEDDKVRLEPLQHTHVPQLIAIGKQKQIWERMSIDGTDAAVLTKLLNSAILKRSTGEQYPFAVIDKTTGKLIGCTMFHNIFPEHRKLEIGWTWYDPAYWRTGYNRHCKLLLLSHAFETLKAIRVQLQTDEHNDRSRDAILGIGATYEGLLRNDRIRANGAYRNTMMFSIIESQWDQVKEKISSSIAR